MASEFVSEGTVLVDALELAMEDEQKPHVACCVEDKTYCGARFHPEAIADDDVDEDDCCEACIDTMYLCISTHVRKGDGMIVQHMTCPVTGQPCVDPIEDEAGQGKSHPSQ